MRRTAFALLLLACACATPQPAPVLREASPLPGTLGIVLQERGGRVVVSDVGRGTPASGAGLLRGDVVLRYNGEQIGGVEHLNRRILDSVPGTIVHLEILRGGEVQHLRVRVGEIDTSLRV